MRVRVAVPAADGEGLDDRIKSAAEQIERTDKAEMWEYVCWFELLTGAGLTRVSSDHAD